MQEELSVVRAKDDFDVLGDLPRKNIDTGMGLERVAFLLQGVDNLYEIDQVFPVLARRPRCRGRPTATTTTTTCDCAWSPTTSGQDSC